MNQSVPASSMQQHCLNYTPDKLHCMLGRNAALLINMIDTIVYLYFVNNTGCWYYLNNVRGNTAYGYRYRNGKWNYQPMDLRRICTYY